MYRVKKSLGISHGIFTHQFCAQQRNATPEIFENINILLLLLYDNKRKTTQDESEHYE